MNNIELQIINIKQYIGTLELKIADLYDIADDLQTQINNVGHNDVANI